MKPMVPARGAYFLAPYRTLSSVSRMKPSLLSSRIFLSSYLQNPIFG